MTRYFLKSYLVGNQIKIADFARLLDISRQHLSGFFSGKSRPAPILAKRISRLTGLKFEEILFGKNEK